MEKPKYKSVYNYETVRWLERHHRQKKVSRSVLDEERIKQLKEMFDHLDEDDSGCIEVSELELAMKFLGLENEQSKILEQFNYMDTDGSGSIDFEEFVTVMTSDIVDQEFFQLQDENEAAKWDLAFFLFATNFRRQKLIDEISEVTNVEGKTLTDNERYKYFHTLFQVPVLPSSLSDDDARKRQEKENGRRKKARQREIIRTKQAKTGLIMNREIRHAKAQFGSRFKKGQLPPFHMHPNVVPREKIGIYERNQWKPSPLNRLIPSGLTNSHAWNVLPHRSVKMETQFRRAAITEARQLLGTQKETYTPRPPSSPSMRHLSFKQNR